ASDTRSPWRNISNNRQRSRASLRPPLAAPSSRSTSRLGRCSRRSEERESQVGFRFLFGFRAELKEATPICVFRRCLSTITVGGGDFDSWSRLPSFPVFLLIIFSYRFRETVKMCGNCRPY